MARNFLFSPIHEAVLNLDNPNDKAKLEEIGSRAEKKSNTDDTGLKNPGQGNHKVGPKQLDFNFANKQEIEKKIATMGDRSSDGAWKKFVEDNQKAEKKDNELRRLVKFGVENSSTPVSKAPPGSKKQKTDVLDYVNKMVNMYEGDGNFYPSQATPTQVGEVSKRLEESRQMTGEPNTWNLMKQTASTPEEKNEIRRILNKEYYKRGPKNMDPADLKFIGKHKSQIVYPEIKVPHIDTDLTNKPTPPPEPQIPIEQTIQDLADKRLAREQKDWDRQWGTDGIVNLKRPI